MAQVRTLTLLGNPILRQIASPVGARPAPGLEVLAGDLVATLEASSGVGIAAPQVDVGQRVIVVASRPNSRYPSAPSMEPLVMVDPILEWLSPETEAGWEGCLSIPGLRGLVLRSLRVGLTYDDVAGTRHDLELEGFPARIFQHEFDHLEGVLFVDRVESSHDLASEEEYLRRFV